jgi:hypothetical protein
MRLVSWRKTKANATCPVPRSLTPLRARVFPHETMLAGGGFIGVGCKTGRTDSVTENDIGMVASRGIQKWK